MPRLNRVVVTNVTKGRPFVDRQNRHDLDGWTATSNGHTKWSRASGQRMGSPAQESSGRHPGGSWNRDGG